MRVLPDDRFRVLHPPFGFYLLTETHTGPVGILLKLGDVPVGFDRSTWLLEEFDIELSSEVFSAVPIMGDGDSPDMVPPHPGRYRVTVLGTDREDTGEWGEPADERYVVFLEPSALVVAADGGGGLGRVA